MRCICWTIVLFALLTGCSEPEDVRSNVSPDASDTGELEPSSRSLGWLDARCRPSESVDTFTDEEADEQVTPGGVRIVDVESDRLADQAGLQRGDTIVQVAGKWLPFKEDPVLDFMRMLEEQITGGKQEIELGIADRGKVRPVVIRHGMTSLDDGLPLAVSRYDVALRLALKKLCSLQNKDGSFPSRDETDVAATIRTTAAAGLAMLAGGASHDDSEFQINLEKAESYLAGQIDTHIALRPATELPADAKPAANTIVAPSTTLDPLTTAYVMQFLAESDFSLLDSSWMKRFSSLVAGIAETQAKNGGWLTTTSDTATDEGSESTPKAEEEPVQVDVLGTHATNQVLLALGAAERKGMMGDNEIIAAACKYLKAQATARVADTTIDRRTKAALLAGTGAALIGVNCDRSDGFLTRSLKDCSARTGDLLEAPTLGIPGLWSNAMFARAMGNESWIGFHNSIKYQWASRLDSQGTFDLPASAKPLEPESATAGNAWKAAHLCLVLGAQGKHLPKHKGQAQTPMMVSRDSNGKLAKANNGTTAGIPGLPKGAKVIRLEGGNLDDIKDKLKDMGIDIEGGDVQMIQSDKVPE